MTPDALFAIEGSRQIRDALRRHDCLSGEISGGDLKFAEQRLTFGAIVGVVELVAVHSFDESGEDWVGENFPACEKHFGNYERGRFGWVFKNPVAFLTPIPCRGLQSLGTPRAEVRAQITGALRATTANIKYK